MTFIVAVIYSSDSIWPRSGRLTIWRIISPANQKLWNGFWIRRWRVSIAPRIRGHVARKAGFDEDDLSKIGMAVRESMVNAVVHGNRYNANKKVHFSVATDAGAVYRFRSPMRAKVSTLIQFRIRWPKENLLRTRAGGFF